MIKSAIGASSSAGRGHLSAGRAAWAVHYACKQAKPKIYRHAAPPPRMPRGVRPQPDSSREISALTLLPPATRPLVLKKKRAGEAARPEQQQQQQTSEPRHCNEVRGWPSAYRKAMLMQVQVALSNVEARALVSPLKTKRISDRTSRRKAISWAQHPTPQPRGARSRFADGDALTKPSIMNCLACDLSPNAILQHEEQKMRQQKQVSE